MILLTGIQWLSTSAPLEREQNEVVYPDHVGTTSPFSLLSHFQGFGGPWALEGTILKAATQNEEEILATSLPTHRQDQLSSLQSWWKQ